MRLRRPLGVVTVAVAAASLLLSPVTPARASSTDLFFSEYIEGSSNNKALEIYNGTGAPVDLAAGGYAVQMYFNGGTTASTTVALTGTVAPGDVFVLASASANATILAQADQTSGSSFYNGDDAIVLRRGTAVVDVIGQVGFDPGTEWGTGLTSTADNTIRRAPAVNGGDTNPADAFDPAGEWIGYATDTFDGLGAHTTTGGDQPAVLTCGGVLATAQGTAASRVVTGVDPDGILTDLAVAADNPAITRTAFTPATTVGGTASATVTVDASAAAGSYPVTVTGTNGGGATATCVLTVQVTSTLTVGEVQGPTTDADGRADRSPFAPATGNGTNGTLYDIRGVITERVLARTATGGSQNGFFLQSRLGTADADPTSSDGAYVFTGSFTTLIGGYLPKVGDEVIIRAKVSEYYNMTELSGASLVRVLDTGLDVDTAVAVTDTTPPADRAAADLFWERHEGMRMRVRAGSEATSPRHVYASTADSEVYVLDPADPLLARTDPYARHVFRDTHPMDNDTTHGFDDDNANRILLGSQGIKAAAGDNTTLVPPARLFDTLAADAFGAVTFDFDKYSVQPSALSFAQGIDPAGNQPVQAADRTQEFSVATYNMENLYDYRDDPFDGCDFTGNSGCPGVSPPFDYVPASAAEYEARVNGLARQIITDLKTPDLILTQEAEDQDICSVQAGALVCGTTNNADGKPDVLQEVALAIAANGGPTYDTAYDRDGADARGIVSAFLYRTDRLTLAAPASVLTATPGVAYRSAGLPYNADVSNPKSLNALLPADTDTSTGKDGNNVFTRAPQVARFTVAATPGNAEGFSLWAVSNHFSSGPDTKVGQRREQARYGAAITTAIQAADPAARIVFGGDLNVFPRPDDPIAKTDSDVPSDQLGPLYTSGLTNLWDDLAADQPATAFSYIFDGQAQTLDHLFVNPALHSDLVRMRSAHINADFPADFDGDGDRGYSDHDPQVAVFRSLPRISVADASVAEGNTGRTSLDFTVSVSRPLSVDTRICGAVVDGTAQYKKDYTTQLVCGTLHAGSSSVVLTVSVVGDKAVEPDETLQFIAIGDSPLFRYARQSATGRILNDD